MNCPAYEDQCPDPEACQQSWPCYVVRSLTINQPKEEA